MKPSYYNFIFNQEEWSYWYNALTGRYFKLSKSLSDKISQILEKQADISKLPEKFYQLLVDNGFIVSKDTDELQIVRDKHNRAVNKKDYFLIILPTLNCNFKCWYCIQDHITSVMSPEVMQAVKNHIDYMINEEKIDSLHLDWFGGEPFMYFDKVIKPLTTYAIEKCKEADIPFKSGATTNGYFINSKVSSQLSDLCFKQFQITLDGSKVHHDKVNYMQGCPSAFEHVLKNINHFLSETPDVVLFLRINYTHETLSDEIVSEVCSLIDEGNRSRVAINPKKVWQENIDKDFPIVIEDILSKFESQGFNVVRNTMINNYLSCYVNQKYYNSINFNGHVVKCTASDDLYSDDPKGKLMPDGKIQWFDDHDKKCIAPTFETEECLKCKCLPSCMGPCPRESLNDHTTCKYKYTDEDFETSLLNFLTHQYK